MTVTRDITTCDPDWIPGYFVAECKQECRLDALTPEEDLPVNIRALITSAIRRVEDHQWRVLQPSLLTATFQHTRLPDAFPDGDMRVWLPYGRAITKPVLKFYDYQDALQTVPDASLRATLNMDACWIAPSRGVACWDDLLPQVSDDHPETCSLTWTSGYTTFASIHGSTRTAIRLLTKHLYFNPNEQLEKLPASIFSFADQDSLHSRKFTRFMID
jgi:hypothetical protein